MTTAIIIQARLGSTRLPGKVLLDLGGRSVLSHVLERAAAIRNADLVCCAVAEGSDSDPVAAEAGRSGALVVRGDERDVLGRYLVAARAIGADLIMRITSDCPLIDPEVCAAVIDLRARTGADLATNNLPPSWPHGLDCEIFTGEWLERAAWEARRPSEREHVSTFIRNHEAARKANLPGPGGAAAAQRWTLDTPEDLAFLRTLMALLPPGRAGWPWRIAHDIVAADPALAAVNAGQDRHAGLAKSLAEDTAQGFALNMP